MSSLHWNNFVTHPASPTINKIEVEHGNKNQPSARRVRTEAYARQCITFVLGGIRGKSPCRHGVRRKMLTVTHHHKWSWEAKAKARTV